MQKIAILNPLIADEKSAKRGVGRYVSALIEALGDDAHCISTMQQLSNETVLLNPFINFYQPPIITKRYTAKQIGVIHDVIPLQYPREFPIGLKGKFHLWQNKRALPHYDTIITDSIASKNSIEKILGIGSTVVYPATSGKLLTLTPKKPDTLLPDDFCLYVGDGTWNKNLVAMAHVITETHVPLVLAGGVFTKPASDHPWEKELQEFQRITKDNPLFIPVGFVTDAELAWLYQHAKYNVLLSRNEGFGYSYLEAAQQGTPSVLSDISVFREIAKDTAVFVPMDKPSTIPLIEPSLGKRAKKRSDFFSLKNFRSALLKACFYMIVFGLLMILAQISTVSASEGYTNHIGIGQTEKDASNSNTMALWVYIFMSVVYVVFIQLAMQMRTQFNRFLLYGAFILGGVIGYFMNNYLMGFFVAMLLSLLFW